MHPFLQVNQQPQPQPSLPQPQLPKPPQSKRIIIRITIQEDPPQPQLLQPHPIALPPFAFLNHTMKSKRKCYPKYLNYNSAVNAQNLPGYITVFRKEKNASCNIFGSSQSFKRNFIYKFFF